MIKMVNKILIISHVQFGYLIDYYQYCKYLKDNFEITYICWDYKSEKIEEPGVVVYYVPRNGNILKRNLRFIQVVLKFIKAKDFKIAFISHFLGVSLIPILGKNIKGIHLDIRTGSVSSNVFSRTFSNMILFFESQFFKHISVISTGLRKLLHLNKNAIILPLGANPIYLSRNPSHDIHLLYVGVLSNRNLEDTIDGIGLFCSKHPEINIHYTIVGEGHNNERFLFQKRINKLGLQQEVELIGYVKHSDLIPLYCISNIGISYIPMTPYYEFQPATKTYEYLMAGMPVIATKTYENKLVINKDNGILIEDNPESFAEGIFQIYNNLKIFNESKIRKSVENYEWERIIQTMRKEILD